MGARGQTPLVPGGSPAQTPASRTVHQADPNVRADSSIGGYGKTQVNFLAKPTHEVFRTQVKHPRDEKPGNQGRGGCAGQLREGRGEETARGPQRRPGSGSFEPFSSSFKLPRSENTQNRVSPFWRLQESRLGFHEACTRPAQEACSERGPSKRPHRLCPVCTGMSISQSGHPALYPQDRHPLASNTPSSSL